MNKYLEATELLDYDNASITNLFIEKGWDKLDEYTKILNIYNFVRDEILFGYNISDNIPASKVLADFYGQCNTKGILLMALLRKAKIQCRFHGFTIDKKLQKGAITGMWYKLSPKSIVHSWVEIKYEDIWYNLEGFIIDTKYLNKIQLCNAKATKFCGFGIATNDLMNPPINWEKNDTYIQKEGINADLGVYDNPDLFFSKNAQNLNLLKKWLFQNIVRHLMNKNVKKIRHLTTAST